MRLADARTSAALAAANPTISDVARLAGVSKKTVSRVINDSPQLRIETRKRIELVIAELGYVPNLQARSLATGRNSLIGLIHDNPNSQMILGVQQGILEAIRETDFALVIRPVDRGSPGMMDDVRRFLDRQRLYGVMLLPPISENDELAQHCAELGCRYVRMGSAPLDDDAHSVSSNDAEAVAEATRHLIGLGHRRIGLIAGPHGFRSAAERRVGFLAALAEAGVTLPPGMTVRGDYRFDSGIAAASRLLDQMPPPTAILACNDEMAAGALHAARQRNLTVPRDLSIVGFDDTSTAAHVWPPLTTVRWPIQAMGRSAARKLLAGSEPRMDGVTQPSVLPSELVMRASVGPPAMS
ncbi:LacI family DNA-binding transcriptional regulator [Sphingomonas faeni]|uniref:LacI family DNA-binding transcriptional regulator n=1 Tax=Sphingomonas faeni TaxID=185950 RepID=UPI0027D8E9C8|nr:LacI family DNA-binding transcriptional regulator [Sphingomonas faeni]